MAGRIRAEDIATVRDRSPIEAVVGEYLQLRAAGGGRLKGLCPFHEERTPSFTVNPAKGLFHCFGCQAGGDVFTFIARMENLGFTETVERLADRAGVELTYEQGGAAPGRESSRRGRLIEAARLAEGWFAEMLRVSPDAAAGRAFLRERGFDEAAWQRFGVGYAPRGWDNLLRALARHGCTAEELQGAGLTQPGRHGPIDRFRGRLVWPIRDVTGTTVGFGARRLYEEDTGPKYLNSPETQLFSKSRLLYGLDLARREIGRTRRAVVVEGYTDVMACHLAGVTTAVATCGTAFGTEHISVLRRLLMDREEFRGEVVFTFDGDAAGRHAALAAFDREQQFVTQTFVAVTPGGLDPCDLRLQRGDAALQALVDGRVPLFEFAIRSAIARYDLETPEGRVRALAAAAPIVAGIRDRALRPEYVRALAGWLGMDPAIVLDRVAAVPAGAPAAPVDTARGAGGRSGWGSAHAPSGTPTTRQATGSASAPGWRAGLGEGTYRGVVAPEGTRGQARGATGGAATHLGGGPGGGSGGGSGGGPGGGPGRAPARGGTLAVRRGVLEREVLKVALQVPRAAGAAFDAFPEDSFAAPGHRLVRRAVAGAGGALAAGAGEGRERAWLDAVLAAADDDRARELITALAVEPLLLASGDEAAYAESVCARFAELGLGEQIEDLRGRLQRSEAAGDTAAQLALFAELMELEGRRQHLRTVAMTIWVPDLDAAPETGVVPAAGELL